MNSWSLLRVMRGRLFRFISSQRWKIRKELEFIIGLDIITMGDFSLTRTKEGTLMEFVFNHDYFIHTGDDTNSKWRSYQTIYNLIRKFEGNK